MIRLIKERNGVPCHDYIDDDKPWMEYVPVSTVKGSYKQPVNSEDLAAKCINNINSPWFGKDYDWVLNTWEKMRIDGLNNGTYVHKVIENYLNDDSYYGATEKECDIIESFEQLIPDLQLNEVESIFTEYAVSVDICNPILKVTAKEIESENAKGLVQLINVVRIKDTPSISTLSSWPIEKLVALAKKLILRKGLAGTIDIVKNFSDLSFGITDIKTDKKINTKSFYDWDEVNRRKVYRKMKPPLSNLDDCNWSEYCLQVELYALMYAKETGRRYRGAEILHWNKTDEDPQFRIYKTPSMKRYAGRMINDYFQITAKNVLQRA